MIEELSKLDKSISVNWECVDCIQETEILDKENGVKREIPGFFQSSKYLPKEIGSSEMVLVDPERVLDGCTLCGKGSPVLQLILRTVV